MQVEEDNYENIKNNSINDLPNLNYTFSLNNRFVHVKDNDGKYFKCQTPFLKILKPVHVTLNKKKTIARKYIILETSDELDFNNQIGDFLFIINKIHEISQERIKENSVDWFDTEFDEIGLDIKVRSPVEQQRDNEFIRICIPLNTELEERVKSLNKDDYILSNIIFKGLKVSSDYIMEEWELNDFITQEKYDEMQNTEITLENNELIETIIEEELNKENNEISIVEVNNITEIPNIIYEKEELNTQEYINKQDEVHELNEKELSKGEELINEININKVQDTYNEPDNEINNNTINMETDNNTITTNNTSKKTKSTKNKHKIIKKNKKILYI